MKPVDPRLARAVPRLRGYLGRLALLTTASAGLLVVQATLLVDVVVRGCSGRVGPGELAGTLGAFVCVVAARAGVGWLVARDGERTAPRVIADLRARALGAAVASAESGAAAPSAGRIALVTGAGLDGLETYLTRFLPALVTVIVIPPVVLAVLAHTDLTSAVILGVTLPLVPVFMVLVGLATRARTEQRLAVLTRLSHHFLDVVSGLATLRVFGRARAQVETIRRVSEAYRVQTMASLRLAFASSLVMELLATLSVALVAVSVGLRLVDGSVCFSAALLVLVLAPEVHAPLRQVGAQFHATMTGLTAACAALDLVDAAPPVPEPALGAGQPSGEDAASPVEVRLADVELRRPGLPEPTLQGVTLTLRPGEITALVGPSGAGKSSLVDILRGGVRPSAGQVLVDGVDVATLAPAAWRDRVAWLPQRPHALAAGAPDLLADGRTATVADEVALGLPRWAGRPAPAAAGMDAAVTAAVAAAGAPDADKPLGEDGRALSAGELRRVALARTLARRAPLILLDEPSESVDSLTEAHVAAAVAALRGHATVLVVAHSSALVQAADRVITLDAGRVVADESRLVGRHTPPGPATASSPRPHQRGSVADRRVHGPNHLPRFAVAARTVADERAYGLASPPRFVPDRHVLRVALAGSLSPRGWARLGLGVAAGTGAVLAGFGLTGTAAWLISRASAHPPVLTLMVAAVAVRAFGLGRPVLRYAERLLTHDAALRGLAGLRAEAFRRLAGLSPAALAGRRRGDLLRGFTADVDGLAEALPRAFTPLAVAALTAVAATTAFTVMTPSAGPLVAAGLLLTAAAAAAGTAAARAGRHAASRERACRDAAVVALAERLDEAVAFGVAAARLEALRRRDADLVRLITARRRSAAWAGPAQALVAGLCTAAIAAVGAAAVHHRALGWELFAVLVLLTPAVFEPVAGLGDALAAAGDARDAATRLADVLPVEVDRGASMDTGAGGGPVSGVPHGPLAVRLIGVRAGYPGTPAACVLDGVDLEVPAGARIALTGASGAGKSTVASLLTGLAEPAAGHVELGGVGRWVDLRDVPEERLRGAVVALTQDAHVFDATIRENLRLARPEASDAELMAMLGRVGLADWLAALPRGLDTRVGPDGACISGGQRQRLLLARVLLTDARILVIDEPTAHLDAATERQIVDLLFTLPADRTVVVITHRSAGLDRMDAVYQVSDRRVSRVERPCSATAAGIGSRALVMG